MCALPQTSRASNKYQANCNKMQIENGENGNGYAP